MDAPDALVFGSPGFNNTGAEDHRHVRPRLQDFSSQLDPAHPGHASIGDHQIDSVGVDQYPLLGHVSAFRPAPGVPCAPGGDPLVPRHAPRATCLRSANCAAFSNDLKEAVCRIPEDGDLQTALSHMERSEVPEGLIVVKRNGLFRVHLLAGGLCRVERLPWRHFRTGMMRGVGLRLYV